MRVIRKPKPTPPEWLLPSALAEWNRVLPDLVAGGAFTDADTAALAGYCQSFAHWMAAEQFMQLNGTAFTVRDDKGNVKFTSVVPQFGIAQKALDKMLRFGSELGLTPISRAKLKRKRAAGGNSDLSGLLKPRLAE